MNYDALDLEKSTVNKSILKEVLKSDRINYERLKFKIENLTKIFGAIEIRQFGPWRVQTLESYRKQLLSTSIKVIIKNFKILLNLHIHISYFKKESPNYNYVIYKFSILYHQVQDFANDLHLYFEPTIKNLKLREHFSRRCL